MDDGSSEGTCWKCKTSFNSDWFFCANCGARLRDTRQPILAQPADEVRFLRDLYSFSWYNRQVDALALYKSIEKLEQQPGNPEYPIEPIRVRKVLRMKIFAEFIGLLESFGYLCIAIRKRKETGIIWTYLNTQPSDVTQFYNNIFASSKLPNLLRLLKLPGIPELKIANAAHPEVSYPELQSLKSADGIYSNLLKNIQIAAQLYRGQSAINVYAYNRVKHVFSVMEGTGWFRPLPDDDHADVILDLTEEGHVNIAKFSLDQQSVTDEVANIQAVTDIGAELLAVCLALNDLGALL